MRTHASKFLTFLEALVHRIPYTSLSGPLLLLPAFHLIAEVRQRFKMASSSCFVDSDGGLFHLHCPDPSEQRGPPPGHHHHPHLANSYSALGKSYSSLGFESSWALSKNQPATPRNMAFWTMPYRAEASDRDHSFFWQDVDGVAADDSNDFFGQFVDFDDPATAQPNPSMTSASEGISASQAVPRLPESLLLEHAPESIVSSSTADEFDFLSSSSNIGPSSSLGQDVNPGNLAATSGQATGGLGHQQLDHNGRGSISDTDLPRVEGISLSSPSKSRHDTIVSQPASPVRPNTTRRATNRIVEAVQSTFRKATTRRKPRKPLPETRPGSPTGDEAPLKAPRQRPRGGGRGANNKNPPARPQAQQSFGSSSGSFIHGACEDPFNEVPPLPPPSALRYFQQDGVSPPMVSPAIKSEPGSFHADHTTSQIPSDVSWEHQPHPSSLPGSSGQWTSSDMMTPANSGWWDYNMLTQNGEFVDQKNADFNMATHSQQAQLPYEYQHRIPDTATTGLMIQMPQPRQAHPSVVHDFNMNAQGQLPPPPPPPHPASERQHRPPRAPSSGARHISCSPVRKPRAPSASPTRTTPTATQKRHSSGGSISSSRSASGRLPGSMPGTPCNVRKRRSREPSGGSANGGMEAGFVNFTPNDGGMLMTGVAPSGSSKTKARREKEALDRRRKLSEAALKAVAAAGGDVETLMQQGFTF